MYSDLFSDLTQNMASQPIKGSQLSQKRMEFQFRWQLITNHSVFARSRNVQITGVGGLIHSCNIVNHYQTWNQTCSVCVKVSKHTFWSAFGALYCAIYGNVFNISRDTSFGNLGDNTCDVGGTRNTGRGGGITSVMSPIRRTLQRCTLAFRKWIIRCRSSCMMFRWRCYVLSPFMMIVELKFHQFSFG